MGDYTLPQAVGQGKDNQSPLVAREAKSFCEPFPRSPTLRGPNKHTSLGRNLHSRIDKADMSYKENEKNTWNINFATLIFVFRLWVSEACLLFSLTPWPGQTITCRPHTRSRIGALCPEDFTMRCPRGAALQNLKTYPHRLLLRSFSGLWGWPRPEGRAGSVKLKNPNFRMPKCSPHEVQTLNLCETRRNVQKREPSESIVGPDVTAPFRESGHNLCHIYSRVLRESLASVRDNNSRVLAQFHAMGSDFYSRVLSESLREWSSIPCKKCTKQWIPPIQANRESQIFPGWEGTIFASRGPRSRY